ncbi:MAG: NAD-dependent epimerase/dehydratase family protein [Candidatus Heimdallarchaeota archaeon]
MKILITGAFGSLGSHILDLLVKSDHNITCFSTNSNKSKRVAKKYRNQVDIFVGDIRNFDDVIKAVHDQDLVLHLAAIVPPKFNSISLDYSREV